MANVSVKISWNEGKLSQIDQNIRRGLVRMAFDIGNQARRNAPYKTGALSNSIRVQEKGNEVEVIAGGSYAGRNIPYAAIQEFGGYAGRNHSSRITGTHYMERAKDTIMSGNYLNKYFGGIL